MRNSFGDEFDFENKSTNAYIIVYKRAESVPESIIIEPKLSEATKFVIDDRSSGKCIETEIKKNCENVDREYVTEVLKHNYKENSACDVRHLTEEFETRFDLGEFL